MLPLPAWIFCALLFTPVPTEPVPPTPALLLWQRGQDIMRAGDSGKAIPYFEQSLQLDPQLARNHLSLAAAYADQGQEESAVLHMARYVKLQPDHYVARLHYAEMLLRLSQPQAARVQYERFIADVQERDDLANAHLLQCHSRLMDLYEAASDDYHEHLNRGLGLFQLACQRADLGDPDGDLSVEGLLFRAAGELLAARQSKCDEARACWYLHRIWSRLGQQQPATHWLRAAEAAAPFSELTPSEQCGLAIAWERFQHEGQK